MVQYWRSVEHLERFARDSSLPHHAAWRRFNQRVSTFDVGIWHETYLVSAGNHEAVYVNMPRFGLAAAGEHLPVAARGERAAQRRASARRAAELATEAVELATFSARTFSECWSHHSDVLELNDAQQVGDKLSIPIDGGPAGHGDVGGSGGFTS